MYTNYYSDQMQFVCLLIVVALCLCLEAQARSKLFKEVSFGASPVDAVNILGGTDSRYDLSRGSTLPLTTRPWGFNGFAPQTDDDPTWPGWWFHPSDRRYFGLRLTHQPSPWISDYGNFLIKAYMPSNPTSKTGSGDDFTGYSPSQATFTPYYFATELFGYGNSNGYMKVEFTPSMHGGILRATFPKYIAEESGDSGTTSQLRRLSIVLPQNADVTEVGKSPIDGTVMLSGHTTKNSGGVGGKDAAYAHYFVAAIYSGDGTKLTSVDAVSTKAGGNVAWVDFNPRDGENDVLIMRLATSFISQEQALLNLQQEVDVSVSFEALKDDARDEWNSVLSRIQVTRPPEGSSSSENGDLYAIFYSSLYRASLFPRQLTEFTATGEAIHWSPFATSPETRIMPGPLSTDSGFWDAWNTIYPLLTLFHRPQLAVTVQGWLTAFAEGGWLPKWASPGYRSGMIGTMGDVSLADAIVKEIPGFDVSQAYEAIRKDAFQSPPLGVEGVGRVCLSSYLEHNYVPKDAPMTTGGTCYEVVSRTLNYLQSDYAVSQAAKKLNRVADFNVLSQRAQNFSLLFDEQTGFFRSRSIASGGKFTAPFDQFAWGEDYTEAGPWQYRFYLPYAASELNQLYKTHGDRDMCRLLHETMTTSSLYHLGGYSSFIHEQTEMADHCFGQYAHNNQPVHHMLYMHLIDGYSGACSAQGYHYLRKTLLSLYRADTDMFPGDEDNGEMGAWFVLTAMGLYERSPGSDLFEFGLPLFSHMTVDISDVYHTHSGKHADVRKVSSALNRDKKTLEIIAHNNTLGNTRVEKITWNKVKVDERVNGISYAELAKGGVLEFFLAAPLTTY